MHRFPLYRSPALTTADGLVAIRHWFLLAVAALAAGPLVGCSSAISMRDSLRASVEQAAAMTQLASLTELSSEPHAAKAGPVETASYETERPTGPTYAELADSLANDPAAVAAAIELAINELAEADSLDTASKAALMETLEMTPQADWPVVITEFTETLTALRSPATIDDDPTVTADKTTGTGTAATKDTAFEASHLGVDTAAVLVTSETAASESDQNPEDTSVQDLPLVSAEGEATVELTSSAEDDVQVDEPQAAAAPTAAGKESHTPATSVSVASTTPNQPGRAIVVEDQTNPLKAPQLATVETISPQIASSRTTSPTSRQLVITNPCIVREVRGWGMVEPFAPEDLQPGAEVIIYFELTGLTGTPAPSGIITQVATSLRLEGPEGNQLHSWSFPPITETCSTQRQDYFARYLLDLPKDLSAGSHCLTLSVTDQQGSTTAEQIVPLVIVPRQPEAAFEQD